MGYDGSLKFDTSLDGSGFSSGLSGMTKNIVGAQLIVKALSAAFDVVKSSASKAFSRIDTMEQFQRTMTAITGDSNAAGDALETLKTITKGTAYGLDVAAKATQDFVTRGLDISKATKQVEIWGDAVAFYGDGSNEQFQSVTDALAKMTTKGKVEMDQLNRLFDAGIDAVGMYAQATGRSSADVQADLSAGKISTQEFVDVVTTAMVEGTNGVQKIAGAAKEAGTSWQGSFDNMRAACARGVEAIVKSIDEGLASIDMPSMRGMISDFGTAFENTLSSIGNLISDVFKSVQKLGIKGAIKTIKNAFNDLGSLFGDVARKVIPSLVNAFVKITKTALPPLVSIIKVIVNTLLPPFIKIIDTLADNFSTLLPFIVGIAAAFKAWSIVQTITGMVQKAIEAQYLWNAAMNANPVGILITAIVALGAAIGASVLLQQQAVDQANENWGKVAEGATKFSEGVKNAQSHLSEFNDTLFASSEEQQNLQTNMDEVQQGITTICRTATEERRNLTASEIEQLDEYFAKLNELNAQQLSIEQSKMQAIAQQATQMAETHSGSLAEYEVTAQEWIATAQEQASAMTSIIDEQTQTELALLMQKYGDEAVMSNEAYKAEYDAIMQKKEDNLALVNGEVANITAEYAKGYAERAGLSELDKVRVGKDNESIESENQRHIDEVARIREEYAGDEQAMQTAIAGANSRHEENLSRIWNELSSNMGDEQIAQYGTLLAMAADIDLYGGKMDEETQKTVDSIISAYESMPEGTQSAMKDAMSPMLTEMQNSEPGLFAKATSIADGILSRLKNAFDIHSPSRKVRKIFQQVMEGAPLGIEDEEDTLYKKIDVISDNSVDQMEAMVARMQNAVNAENTKAAQNITARTTNISNQSVQTSHNKTENIFNINQPVSTPSELYKETLLRQKELAYG